MTLEPAATVDLWVAWPEQLHDAMLEERWRAWLSPGETRRYSKFHFDRHRHEYLVTRALVRIALSSHRATSPEAWSFRENEYGRPEIDPPVGLRFNLSNVPSLVVCLVSEHHEVGVDVEPLARATQILEVADTVFSSDELAALRAQDGEAMRDRAVSLWTIKESYIKARGAGMSLPLRDITIELGPRLDTGLDLGAATRFRLGPSLNDDAEAWCVRTLDIDAHRIACTVRCGVNSSMRVRVVNAPMRST
ncbi:MAG: 4'-phosphopantetheinyl transferase family protein [Polyangiaceae bacterium]